MHRVTVMMAATMLAAAAVPAMAQGRGRGNDGIPPGQRPPAGMCRIWIDGVPPGRQPAATDCATAAAQRPANARIIYGDQTSRNNRSIYDNNNRSIYDNNRSIYDNNRGIYRSGSANGDVVIINNRRCVRRTDSNGQVHTYCSDTPIDNNNDRVFRQDEDRDRDGKHFKAGKHKKHKGHGDEDRDHDRDRDGDRDRE